MIDNVFELEMDAPRPGVNDVTVDGVSVVHSGNVAEVPAIPNYDSARKVLSLDSTDDLSTLGASSVTEGYNCASYGAGSHSEGYNSVARGQYSHVEGFFNTTNHFCQHVFGQFNSPDPASGSVDTKGQYIEIVGNGEGVDDRANARTLDWEGNEWLAGTLTLGNNNLEVPTILSGRNTPASTDGRENSLYVKYDNEVLVPTFTPLLHYTNNLNVNFTQHEKVRIVIDTSIDPQYPNYHFDAVLDINDSPSGSYVELACYDEQLQEHVILGQINFTESTYLIGSRIGSTNVDINQTLTIYDDVSKFIDDIYFKTDNAWIKDNFKEEITTDIANLTTTVNTLIRTSAPYIYSEGATMAAGAISEDTCAVENITGYTPIGIIGSFTDCTDTNVQVMVFNEHLTSNGVSYKLMNVGGAFSNKNIQVEFKVLYKKNSQ